jgi:hypothetical protein
MFGMVKIGGGLVGDLVVVGGGLVGGVVVETMLGMEESVEDAEFSMEAKRR